MKKPKILFKPIAKYVREISVVVIGVAITPFASYLITKGSEKRKLALYTNSIQMELSSNAEILDYFAGLLEKANKYANYLRSNENKSLNKDTLAYYRRTDSDGLGFEYFLSVSPILQTYAFEMFKLSGGINQIKDKELLFSVWEAYFKIEYMKVLLDKYFQLKEEEYMNELRLSVEGKPVAVPMKIFHSTHFPIAMVQWCKEFSEVLRKTAEKLEEAKNR